jgi:ribonucleoside-diphosphate reductase alpha chain
LMRKFAHQRFEPSGFTKNPEIRNASSIIDYVFRWLALQFIPGHREAVLGAGNQRELAMSGLEDEIKKKVNRPVPDLPLSDDTDILIQATPAAASGTGHGNGHGHAPSNGNGSGNGAGEQAKTVAGRVVASLNDSVSHFQLDAPTCPNCGHVAVRNGACYKCLNCGESLGCS